MIVFEAAPPVPSTYHRLREALTDTEITEARELGYVADGVLPHAAIHCDRALNHIHKPPISDGLSDWRNRMFLVWFCYLFENFDVLRSPLGALEELILELHGGPTSWDMDLGNPAGFAQLWAGAGAGDPLSDRERKEERWRLEPYYRSALRELTNWSGMHKGGLDAADS